MEGSDPAYAPFAATHEDRLVRALMSETGLPLTAAQAVVADVLPAARARSFGSDGAAYGWLRVAARHRATGSATWADAADTAAGLADDAAAALAGLPAADRDLLRLRYAEGVMPATLAERLGLTVAEVDARIDRARAAAARSLTAERTLPVPLPRLAAALALVAAAVFYGGGAHLPSFAPPASAAPGANALDAPRPRTPADAAVPAAAARPAGPGVTGRDPVAVVLGTRRTPADDDLTLPPTCKVTCTGPIVDELHITLPTDVGGHRDVVLPADSATKLGVPVCDTVTAIPAGVAKCERAGH